MRSSAVHVEDGSKVAEARRAALDHARELEWSDVSSANAAIVATELATNLAKHAREGLVSVTTLDGAQSPRLGILSVDHGPGIDDLDASFRDGYSTAGSPGNGLGAVRRLAKSLDVISTREKGTVFFAEMQDPARAYAARAERFAIGGLCVQRAGESVAGDAWDVRHEGDSLAVLVCDGLGHGAIAAEASRQAVATFLDRSALNPKETMERIHQALRPTRGAAAAIAVIDPDAGIVRYCGIGNISAVIVTPTDVRHLVSHNGTLGHIAARFVDFTYPWPAGASLVMHSDGVSARWQPEEWPGLWQRAPSMVAGVIYRDHRRPRDDATVVVVRMQ
jgi:anti-sigma regulatory factor (Ser/Thr protein kinase)